MIVVRSLHIYPIKACAGIDLTAAYVERRGLAEDRRWMVVKDDGLFVTQRDEPRLCLVKTALAEDRLTLSYDGERLELPRAAPVGDRMRVQVWRSRVEAIEHTAARAFISRVVGGSAHLVYMPDNVERPVSAAHAAPGDIVSFADGFPVLLASLGSLNDLQSRIAEPMPMTRFRPNIVVESTTPYAEDTWRRLSIGDVTFRSPKACDRCVVTTVDQETGARGKEPLRTLATYRKWDGAVWFAINLVPEGLGQVRVGDVATLLETT